MDEPVLYVDDDAANLVVLRAACAATFQVETALGGREALEIMQEREVAVLLADQRMPGMTGVELCERAAALYPDVVRMLITAYADLSDTIDAINRGKVSRYVRKPWEPVELIAALRDAVDVYQTRKKLHLLERRLIETERTYALGVIAAGFAHEVRSPLSALQMNTDLARLRLKELRDALRAPNHPDGNLTDLVTKISSHLEAAESSAEQLRTITEGLDLGHRRTDSTDTADLRHILDLTLSFVRATVHRRAQIETDLEDVPPVAASPSKISQVVTNLLVNAVQAMPERPRSENHIRLELRAEDGVVRLVVSDNGVGMSAETLERIFDPFFTTKSEGGTGLGLAISKTIVEEAGGDIDVISEQGRGTRFTIRLRASEGAPSD